MNRTAELVALWATYEEKHPDADIASFCRNFLEERKGEADAEFWVSPVPADEGSLLIKLLGRISKLHQNNAAPVLKQCGINSFEEFLYLNSVAGADQAKKTEVIIANFNELSSGLLVLERLKNSGLITETEDAIDKRAKRLALTNKGKKTLESAYLKLRATNDDLLKDLSAEDVSLCIKLLQPIESSLAKNWLENKKKK